MFVITVAPSYAVSDIVKGVNLNWERTVKLFGIVGYTVLGVWAITFARTALELVHNFVNGNEMTRAAILPINIVLLSCS